MTFTGSITKLSKKTNMTSKCIKQVLTVVQKAHAFIGVIQTLINKKCIQKHKQVMNMIILITCWLFCQDFIAAAKTPVIVY